MTLLKYTKTVISTNYYGIKLIFISKSLFVNINIFIKT